MVIQKRFKVEVFGARPTERRPRGIMERLCLSFSLGMSQCPPEQLKEVAGEKEGYCTRDPDPDKYQKLDGRIWKVLILFII